MWQGIKLATILVLPDRSTGISFIDDISRRLVKNVKGAFSSCKDPAIDGLQCPQLAVECFKTYIQNLTTDEADQPE